MRSEEWNRVLDVNLPKHVYRKLDWETFEGDGIVWLGIEAIGRV